MQYHISRLNENEIVITNEQGKVMCTIPDDGEGINMQGGIETVILKYNPDIMDEMIRADMKC